MQELLTLIEIVRKKGQRSIQLVNQNFRKKEISKDNQLYEGIIAGNFLSDDEAADEMFSADPGNRNYRNAKGKLRQKLLNHLYFLDYEKNVYTAYEKCEYECRHSLHQCKILIREGADDIASRILPQLIKDAQQFEFTDVALQAMEMLRNQYASSGKTTPFFELQEEINQYRQFQNAVLECEEKFQTRMVFINKSISAQNRVVGDMPKVIQFIQKQADTFKSKRLDILAKRLKMVYFQLNWQFEKCVDLCTELEQKYLSKSYHDIDVGLDKKEIAFQKLYAFFFLKHVKAGATYAEKNMQLFKDGTQEWFNFVEYYFLLLMRSEKYKKAGDLFRKVRTNKNYNALQDMDRERWQIYRAYLVFVNDSKLLKWGFDIDGFLQAIPDYQKEYNGLNIATLVIQFLYLLREGEVDEVRKRIDAVQQYSSTHLDKRHNYRNSIFIRMMSIVTEKDFDFELVHEKGQNYYKKLVRNQIPGDLQNDVEVISYETLWDYVLNILKTNKRYVHYRFYNMEVMER
ncbi:MAG: hypothetical protein WBB45_08645 [Cyclobacteriaceae bacterium]